MDQYAPSCDVVVVEPDQPLLGMLAAFLTTAGYSVMPIYSGKRLLDVVASHSPIHVLMDLSDCGDDGIALVKRLRALHPDLSIIAMSGHASIPTVVDAIRSGASNFLEKPFPPGALLCCMREADTKAHKLLAVASRRGLLTERENEVLAQLAHGASSKEAARRLGISPRTVDVHSAHIKKKLNVRRTVDLVRFVYGDENAAPQA